MCNVNKTVKRLSVILAFCLVFSMTLLPQGASAVSAQEMSGEDEKALIEERIKELNNKLSELDRKSADTQEYLNVLNSKIICLGQELDILTDKMQKNKNAVAELESTYEKNQKEIERSQIEIEELTVKLESSQESFNSSYELYCERLYAMYVSGETSLLSFILESRDISEFLTRYEMIMRVSQQDSELLSAIQNEMDGINTSKNELVERKSFLTSKQAELGETAKKLEAGILALQEEQINLDKKRTALSDERAEANMLLKKLADEKGIYTEYLEDDKKTLDEIDRALEEAEKEFATSTTTQRPSTTAPSTTNPENPSKPETDSSASTTINNETKYIKLTYPIPSQTKVTCAMGDYEGHSGCDFSCAMGSRVVAAESGTVIISQDLTNEDGSYRSYGRYIVIMHDKTTPSGDKVYTLYAHNSERLVTAGTYVQKGQLIARSGSTGNSTGPHCHFEVRTPSSAYSDCKNPECYLP